MMPTLSLEEETDMNSCAMRLGRMTLLPDLPQMRPHDFAQLCQRRIGAFATKQRPAELLFKKLDRARQRRLRDAGEF
jgi:hypothetical protein